MALAITGSTATFASSSSAATPAVPDGAVGDLIAWVVGWGTPTATLVSDRPTLSGGVTASVTHVGSMFGGTGTYGTDTGPRGLSCWTAVATATTGATDAVTFTLTGSGTTRVVSALAIRISRDVTKSLVAAFTGGIDSNAADSWAPTGFTNVGAITNDLLLGACAGIPSATNPTLTLVWPGATLGTQTTVRSGGIATGAGVRTNVRSAPVSSGTSTGPPTLNSGTTGLSGVAGILRLREAASASPTANAGVDQTGIEPYSTVALEGHGSDSDGTIASYSWSHISGPSTTGALSSTSAANPTYKAPGTIAGATDVWRLTVTDNSALTGTDDVSITVLPVTERAVIAGAEVPMEISAAGS